MHEHKRSKQERNASNVKTTAGGAEFADFARRIAQRVDDRLCRALRSTLHGTADNIVRTFEPISGRRVLRASLAS